ncbi:MAG: EscU/YscU/HrcU family type III secretion system export apparatus switch protein [Roseibium album]|uniref:Flagellar biosynthetic protein FlhB n=1 Tax=Roseibium album TaxID=311410 RepID=A0A0M6ZBZ9_9HYPH|nr:MULTISPECIES: EscU/YscU/HrcU family type III secretion system export apparatus switch protein [Stappiaceae]MBG6143520.1 flagellar biosynthesis protein [Labrenzia sp. EL_142]MBG6175390.1 flagellar biosynthesis protein [Labrenzia sp. EL_132]MBG6206463.1 flagellar biosynthesis protein [Labrenzia sp. EL_126]MBG6230006.1 flagellar biosynthesis protein [Labrenzia sp. EL_208]MCR9058604.1 EscU/YscU/HrcU family type III secretion system export apparatus switch protein [Paracoccaceae bacterium]
MSSNKPPEKKLAVALQYENEGAPVVTAKGAGSIAEQIERLAKEAGVPIEQNPMMAEALSQIEIDQEIPIELYQAVAVLIGFIMRTGEAQNPGPDQ